jgi:2-polyprenyl-6-methoxyphenol hydroxylase-like FAD-dependent oxidoreductase
LPNAPHAASAAQAHRGVKATNLVRVDLASRSEAPGRAEDRVGTTHEDAPVLIVGGSLVGLSMAVFLGHHGVPSLVVERHRGTAIHPRAALVNQRTIEAYRVVGLQEEVEAAAAREFVQNGAIVSVESLGGKELDWYHRFINEGVETISPSPRLFLTQIGLEPILLRAAERLGAKVEYGSEAVSVEQDAEGVTTVVRPRDGSPDRTVRAQYLVAADGAHSPVRERLGIGCLGHGSFSDSITIYFKADVRRLMGDRNLSVVYVFGPQLQGFFRFSIDLQAGFLVVNSTTDRDGTRSIRIGEDMSEPTCIRYVREALGDPDIPVEIENVQRWAATAEYAERFRERRVFLAGDAVHVMPPTGGFGGNCGVQDAYDLAWKLAYVLRGSAGEELLATYDAERRPVGVFTTEQAYTRYVLRLDPSLGKENLMPIVDEAAVEIGYGYRSPAVTAAPEGDVLWEDPREPTARPGFRAPHAEIEVDGVKRSTLDLYGRDFVLLAGSGGDAWCEAARSIAAPSRVTVDTYRLGADVAGSTDSLASLYGVGAEGAVLVRPDGFVGWRASGTSPDPRNELSHALASAVGRSAG